jgi:hypothetical protein
VWFKPAQAQTQRPGGLSQIAQPLALVGSRGADQNPGTVPEFFLFTIKVYAPEASCLVLKLGELPAYAVILGRLSIARFNGIGRAPRRCVDRHRLNMDV